MMIWQYRNMSECFEVFYVKLYVHSLVDELKWLWLSLSEGSLSQREKVCYSRWSCANRANEYSSWEWLTSVLSNYWVPGSILGKETEYCETFVMVFVSFVFISNVNCVLTIHRRETLFTVFWLNTGLYHYIMGTAVAQWLRCCATVGPR